MIMRFVFVAANFLQDGMGWLPLHQLVMRHGYAEDSIRLLMEYYPEAIQVRTADGWLPLHLLCRYHGGANSSIGLLLALWPESVNEKNGDGWLAIHLLARYAGTQNETLKTVLNKGPSTAGQGTKHEGWLPLHLLAYFHPTAFPSLKSLLEANPQSASSKVKLRGTCANLRPSKCDEAGGRSRPVAAQCTRPPPQKIPSLRPADEHLLPLHMLVRQERSSVECFRLLLEMFPPALLSIPTASAARATALLCTPVVTEADNASSTLSSPAAGSDAAAQPYSALLESLCKVANETLAGPRPLESLAAGGEDFCPTCRVAVPLGGGVDGLDNESRGAAELGGGRTERIGGVRCT